MALFNKKELCPYCFDYFQLSAAPYRCTSHGTLCRPEVDTIYRDHWGDARPLGRVLPPPESVCKQCKKTSNRRVCPICHSDLPRFMGEMENYIIAVIGGKETGKSHFIAVLIDQLKRRIGPSMGFLIEEHDDETITRYRQHFYDPVFVKRETIRMTASGLGNRDVRRPLVYSLTVRKRNFLGREVLKCATLVFFDTAGEDLNAEDVMSAVNKYIYRSQGIILLLDPLQLKEVRKQLNTMSLPSETNETEHVINRTSKLIRKGLSFKSKIPIPIAVTFTKLDALNPLLDPQCQIQTQGRHDRGYDYADFQAINGEVISMLKGWKQDHIINQIESNYEKHGFFGLSSLGCNPHGTNRIERVQPHRVEDPFLWLLHLNGLVSKVAP